MKIVIPCYVSLITFNAAGQRGEHGHIGTFPVDHMLDFVVLLTVFIETEAPVWYVSIAEIMPQCQMEFFTVQYLTSMEPIKICMLEYIHWKMVIGAFTQHVML